MESIGFNCIILDRDKGFVLDIFFIKYNFIYNIIIRLVYMKISASNYLSMLFNGCQSFGKKGVIMKCISSELWTLML